MNWRTLIVEQDLASREAITKSLEGLPLDVQWVESGQGALNVLKQQRFNLVLFDINFHELKKALLESKSLDQYIVKGDLTLNLPMQKASILTNGQQSDLFLTPSEFRLLYYFVSHQGEVLTREQLLKALLQSQGVNVLKRTVDRHVATLRRKFSSKEYQIQTVSRVGYRFQTNR